MKAVLEFDLPEEREEFDLAHKGGLYYSALWEIDQYMRTAIKHGHNFTSIDEALENVRAKLHELVDLE